nr:hypothetical protein Iba_scaffold13492CG0170 [Ipomoea batatas]
MFQAMQQLWLEINDPISFRNELEMVEVGCGGVRRWTLDMGSAGDATRRDGGGARLPVVASSLLLSFFKATPLADGEAAGDTAKGEDGGR